MERDVDHQHQHHRAQRHHDVHAARRAQLAAMGEQVQQDRAGDHHPCRQRGMERLARAQEDDQREDQRQQAGGDRRQAVDQAPAGCRQGPQWIDPCRQGKGDQGGAERGPDDPAEARRPQRQQHGQHAHRDGHAGRHRQVQRLRLRLPAVQEGRESRTQRRACQQQQQGAPDEVLVRVDDHAVGVALAADPGSGVRLAEMVRPARVLPRRGAPYPACSSASSAGRRCSSDLPSTTAGTPGDGASSAPLSRTSGSSGWRSCNSANAARPE